MRGTFRKMHKIEKNKKILSIMTICNKISDRPLVFEDPPNIPLPLVGVGESNTKLAIFGTPLNAPAALALWPANVQP